MGNMIWYDMIQIMMVYWFKHQRYGDTIDKWRWVWTGAWNKHSELKGANIIKYLDGQSGMGWSFSFFFP